MGCNSAVTAVNDGKPREVSSNFAMAINATIAAPHIGNIFSQSWPSLGIRFVF